MKSVSVWSGKLQPAFGFLQAHIKPAYTPAATCSTVGPYFPLKKGLRSPKSILAVCLVHYAPSPPPPVSIHDQKRAHFVRALERRVVHRVNHFHLRIGVVHIGICRQALNVVLGVDVVVVDIVLRRRIACLRVSQVVLNAVSLAVRNEHA